MTFLTIDPGPKSSAWALYDSATHTLRNHGHHDNIGLHAAVVGAIPEAVVIEGIESYGMPVGKDVFETAIWIGRFAEQFRLPTYILYRSKVKLHLCNSRKAKDANIKQALLDLYPSTGGGATPQVGTKGQPGPLYGVSKHVWSALALARTFADDPGSARLLAA